MRRREVLGSVDNCLIMCKLHLDAEFDGPQRQQDPPAGGRTILSYCGEAARIPVDSIAQTIVSQEPFASDCNSLNAYPHRLGLRASTLVTWRL
jgi:hypothetical protein